VDAIIGATGQIEIYAKIIKKTATQTPNKYKINTSEI